MFELIDPAAARRRRGRSGAVSLRLPRGPDDSELLVNIHQISMDAGCWVVDRGSAIVGAARALFATILTLIPRRLRMAADR